MKQIIFCLIGMFFFLCLGCNKDSLNSPDLVTNIKSENSSYSKQKSLNIGNSVEFKVKNLTLKDFQQTGKLWTKADLIKMKSFIGKTPENAIAPISFYPDGKLIYNKEFNEMINQDSFPDGVLDYYTDLETFRELTKQETAFGKYAKKVGKHRWVYDTYQSIYLTDEEWKDKKEKEESKNNPLSTSLRSSNNINIMEEYLKPGNIIWAKWNDSGWVLEDYGHMGMISIEPIACYPSMIQTFQRTSVVEATPPRVIEQPLSKNGWADNNVFLRKIICIKNLRDEYRVKLVEYVRSQIGEPYLFPAEDNDIDILFLGDKRNKNDLNSWYCSKLVWAAYKNVLYLDIDSDDGGLVLPEDIYHSSYLSSVDLG